MSDQQEIAARTLSIQTYIPRDADAAGYNAVLDKLATAADRQEAKGRLIDLQREIAQVRKLIGQHTEDYDRIAAKNQEDHKAAGKSGQPKLSPQERNAQEQAKITAQRYREELVRLEGEILKTKDIIDARSPGDA
jgi:hypothetical protein